MFRKSIGIILSVILIFCSLSAMPASAAGEITITTTLEDGAVLKGSKKTFDVIARDADGNKVSSSVTLNGEAVPINWDDNEKTSFTVTFTKEGENEIVITAGDTSKTIHITYQKAQDGEVTGTAVYCIELFSLGAGYLIEPVEVDIIEGENAAQTLIRLVEENGYNVDYTGKPTSGFYLSGIESGDKALDVTANYPDYVLTALEENGYSPEDDRTDEDWLGEFDYTWGSGWMYTANNVFPNVGFADYYLSDGDVIRVQFTLAYGSDIGGGWGSTFYEVADRDRLTALIAEVYASEAMNDSSVSDAFWTAYDAVQVLNIDEEALAEAYDALNKAYINAEVGSQTPVGDIDGSGKVDAQDVTFCRKALLGNTTLTAEQHSVADLNSDGTITLVDLVGLKKILAGIK